MPITSLQTLHCRHAGCPQPQKGSTWAGASSSLLVSSMPFFCCHSVLALYVGVSQVNLPVVARLTQEDT